MWTKSIKIRSYSNLTFSSLNSNTVEMFNFWSSLVTVKHLTSVFAFYPESNVALIGGFLVGCGVFVCLAFVVGRYCRKKNEWVKILSFGRKYCLIISDEPIAECCSLFFHQGLQTSKPLKRPNLPTKFCMDQKKVWFLWQSDDDVCCCCPANDELVFQNRIVCCCLNIIALIITY